MRLQGRIAAIRLPQRFNGRELLLSAHVIMLALLAFLSARLIWAAIAPIGPLGTPSLIASGTSDTAIFTRFDPFFQAPGTAGPLVVSDLNLDLFGTRVDNVSGRGSAIVGADGGAQRSFFVGEEIVSGVTLHAVAFDSVTISRNGVLEQLFLDQSIPARTLTPTPVPAVGGETTTAITPARVAAEIRAEPYIKDGRIDGVTLAPAGDGELFTKMGFKPGDILLSVNRARIDTKTRAGSIMDLIGDDNVAVFEIRRGAKVQTIRFEVAR